MPHTKMNVMKIIWCHRASYQDDDLFKVDYFQLKAVIHELARVGGFLNQHNASETHCTVCLPANVVCVIHAVID